MTDKSFGLLTITPKDEQGVPVTDFEARILHNADGAEVKEWYALASYLQSMGTVDARYAAPEGRKVVNASWNPIALLKNPGGTTIFALLLALLMLASVLAGCASEQTNNDTNPETEPAASANTDVNAEPAAEKAPEKSLKIVTTIFPEYDWVHEVLGDQAENDELTMLLDNGVDLHS